VTVIFVLVALSARTQAAPRVAGAKEEDLALALARKEVLAVDVELLADLQLERRDLGDNRGRALLLRLGRGCRGVGRRGAGDGEKGEGEQSEGEQRAPNHRCPYRPDRAGTSISIPLVALGG